MAAEGCSDAFGCASSPRQLYRGAAFPISFITPPEMGMVHKPRG